MALQALADMEDLGSVPSSASGSSGTAASGSNSGGSGGTADGSSSACSAGGAHTHAPSGSREGSFPAWLQQHVAHKANATVHSLLPSRLPDAGTGYPYVRCSVPVLVGSSGQAWLQPRSLAELWPLLAGGQLGARPRVVAGNTGTPFCHAVHVT